MFRPPLQRQEYFGATWRSWGRSNAEGRDWAIVTAARARNWGIGTAGTKQDYTTGHTIECETAENANSLLILACLVASIPHRFAHLLAGKGGGMEIDMRSGWEEYAVLIGFVCLVTILAIAGSVIWFLLSTHHVRPPRLDRHAARAELAFRTAIASKTSADPEAGRAAGALKTDLQRAAA